LAAGHYPNGVTLNNAVDINGSLSVQGSTLDVGTGNAAINLAGDWINDGSFRSRSGTVTLDGNSTQTISGSGKNAFATLTIQGASAQILDEGTPAATASVFSINDDGGKYSRSESIPGTGSVTFGLTGAVLDITTDNFSDIKVDLVEGDHANASGSASGENLRTGRYWVITPTGTGEGNLTLPQNNFVASLSVCNYLGLAAPGYHWVCSSASSTTSATATFERRQ
jgi:hypothetical protein